MKVRPSAGRMCIPNAGDQSRQKPFTRLVSPGSPEVPTLSPGSRRSLLQNGNKGPCPRPGSATSPVSPPPLHPHLPCIPTFPASSTRQCSAQAPLGIIFTTDSSVWPRDANDKEDARWKCLGLDDCSEGTVAAKLSAGPGRMCPSL